MAEIVKTDEDVAKMVMRVTTPLIEGMRKSIQILGRNIYFESDGDQYSDQVIMDGFAELLLKKGKQPTKGGVCIETLEHKPSIIADLRGQIEIYRGRTNVLEEENRQLEAEVKLLKGEIAVQPTIEPCADGVSWSPKSVCLKCPQMQEDIETLKKADHCTQMTIMSMQDKIEQIMPISAIEQEIEAGLDLETCSVPLHDIPVYSYRGGPDIHFCLTKD